MAVNASSITTRKRRISTAEGEEVVMERCAEVVAEVVAQAVVEGGEVEAAEGEAAFRTVVGETTKVREEQRCVCVRSGMRTLAQQSTIPYTPSFTLDRMVKQGTRRRG